MNAQISVFVICVEVIVYSLLYNLHHCTFKVRKKALAMWNIYFQLYKCQLKGIFDKWKDFGSFFNVILTPWYLVFNVTFLKKAILTHLMSLVSFYTRRRQKTTSFLMFSWGIERNQ